MAAAAAAPRAALRTAVSSCVRASRISADTPLFRHLQDAAVGTAAGEARLSAGTARLLLLQPQAQPFRGVRCLASGAGGPEGAAGGASAGSSSGASGEAGGNSAGDQQQSASDRQHAESGEYDTQDKYKRIGNPIQWANPMGGGSETQDTSSNHWRWVYPAGVFGILLLCLYSRRRNMLKEDEEKVISTMDIKAPDTRQFSTPAYIPPATPSRGGDADDEELPPPSSAIGGFSSFGGSSGGFSPPPPSGQQSNW